MDRRAVIGKAGPVRNNPALLRSVAGAWPAALVGSPSGGDEERLVEGMGQDLGVQRKIARRGRRAGALVAATALAWLWPLAPAAAQQGNATDGAEVFKKCRACHDVGPEAKNKVGPMLNGVIGRTAGTVPQYAYSEANKTAGTKGLTWSEESLAKYLEDPRAFMPGTKMAFAGLKDPQDRNDLIAYLKTFFKN